MKKFALMPLLILLGFLTLACSASVVENSRAPSSITFTVKAEGDGGSQRVEWQSAEPAGADQQICFERGREIVICHDVNPGDSKGVVMAFRAMPVGECQAHFRSREK